MKMSNEAREARRKYLKEWRQNNKDKVREYNRRSQINFWEKKSRELESASRANEVSD
jgi:hypothetical protein